MAKIISFEAREILDSRGNPTVEVCCRLEGDISEKAAVPSGASTGIHEVLELRDHDPKRYGGLGVLNALENVNVEISEALKGKDFNQFELDNFLNTLDGTQNKSRLGANAILGVSLAFARASAKVKGQELYEYLGDLVGSNDFKLPQPVLNIINGGKHADSGLDFQEFSIIPFGFNTFHEKIRAGDAVVNSLKELLILKGYGVGVGDEGGFSPKLSSNEEGFDLLEQAIDMAGYSAKEISIGIDVAASSFFRDGLYYPTLSVDKKGKTRGGMMLWYKDLIEKYPISLIEDPFSEDDWQGFTEITEKYGDKVKIVGDDLTVTNTSRIKEAKDKDAINSVLIKLNQIGTLTETIEAINLTKNYGWAPFISHRSGETMDTFIADLGVAMNCDYIKAGSLTRGERVCKYNRLMEIEERFLASTS